MRPHKMCACGLPLHYTDLKLQGMVERHVAEYGEYIRIRQLTTSKVYLVPRHYIALHGIKDEELFVVASLLGFEEVTEVTGAES